MKIELYPGINETPNVVVLEQRTDYIKSRSEYSNGFIFISEVTSEDVKISPNFNLVQLADGRFTPDFSSPNKEFFDINIH